MTATYTNIELEFIIVYLNLHGMMSHNCLRLHIFFESVERQKAIK
jgi:hypothetical protein